MRKYLALVLVLVIGVAAVGCDEEVEGDAEEQAESVEADDEQAVDDGNDADGDGLDETDDDAEGASEVDADFDYPGFDLEELDESQRVALAELSFVELCPCEDSQVSLHECMQQEDRCEEADEETAGLVEVVSESSDGQEAADRRAEQRADREQVHHFDLENSPYKGDPNADVIIVEFADFQCPHCQRAAMAMDEVYERFGDDVGIYFKNYPVGGPLAEQAAHAAMAAKEQGQFWGMHELLFENQRGLNPGLIERFSRQLGLNIDRFRDDMRSEEISSRIADDQQDGLQAGVTGTPAIFVNGQQYSGRITGEALSARVGAELAE